MKAFTHARVIDGRGGFIPDGTVVVDGSTIVNVGAASGVEILEGTEIVDCGGRTLMPGLMDAHTHLETTASNNVINEVAQYNLPTRTMRSYWNALETIRAGITTVRDVADIGDCVIAVRNVINQKLLPGPRIIASGKAINQTGGHASMSTEYQWSRPDAGGSGHCVDGEAECRRAIRTEVAAGADLIKIYVTSGLYDPFLGKPRDEFSQKEIEALCEEAANSGKKVAAHCHTAKSAKYCIENGVASIEHGMMINEETLELMKAHGTFWVPTTIVYQMMADGAKYGLGSSTIENSRKALVNQEKMFRKALDMGIKIGIGTDCGGVLINHGETARELECLNRWGMTAMDCIRAATSANAELLGINSITGSVEAGKEADILIVDGDPLEDIRILQNQEKILVVMRGGEYYKDTFSGLC